MTNRIGMSLAVLAIAGIGLGLVQPPQARASDTGKVIAAVAAGVLVYKLLDNKDNRNVEFYRAPEPVQAFGVPEYYNPGVGRPAGPVAKAYNHGFNDGYQVGYGDGKQDGVQKGYTIGYKNGYGDGRQDQRWVDQSRDRGVGRGRGPVAAPVRAGWGRR